MEPRGPRPGRGEASSAAGDRAPRQSSDDLQRTLERDTAVQGADHEEAPKADDRPDGPDREPSMAPSRAGRDDAEK